MPAVSAAEAETGIAWFAVMTTVFSSSPAATSNIPGMALLSNTKARTLRLEINRTASSPPLVRPAGSQMSKTSWTSRPSMRRTIHLTRVWASDSREPPRRSPATSAITRAATNESDIDLVLHPGSFCRRVPGDIRGPGERCSWTRSLTYASMEKVMLVSNLHAGSVSSRTKEVIIKALQADFKLEAVDTARRHHASDLAKDAADRGFDAVLAFGGDGTINETAQGLVDTDVALGVLPGGSTNVLARSFGIPTDPVEATAYVAQRLRDGMRRRINTGRMNDRAFLFSTGMGLDAEVVKRVESDPERKARSREWAFVSNAFKAGLGEYRGIDPCITATVDGGDPEKFMTVVSLQRQAVYLLQAIPARRLSRRHAGWWVGRLRAPEAPHPHHAAAGLGVFRKPVPSTLEIVGIPPRCVAGSARGGSPAACPGGRGLRRRTHERANPIWCGTLSTCLFEPPRARLRRRQWCLDLLSHRLRFEYR